jgi:hypothetical protein
VIAHGNGVATSALCPSTAHPPASLAKFQFELLE